MQRLISEAFCNSVVRLTRKDSYRIPVGLVLVSCLFVGGAYSKVSIVLLITLVNAVVNGRRCFICH